jgi:hypothetical protein
MLDDGTENKRSFYQWKYAGPSLCMQREPAAHAASVPVQGRSGTTLYLRSRTRSSCSRANTTSPLSRISTAAARSPRASSRWASATTVRCQVGLAPCQAFERSAWRGACRRQEEGGLREGLHLYWPGRVQLPHAQDDDGPAPVRGCRHRRAEVRLEPAWRCGNGHGNGTVTVCVLPRVTYMHRLLGVSESYLSEYDLVPFFLSRRRVCLSIRCGPKAPRTQAPRYPDSADRHRSDPTVGLSESVAGSVPCSVHGC